MKYYCHNSYICKNKKNKKNEINKTKKNNKKIFIKRHF